MAPKIVDKDEKRIRIAHAAVLVFGKKGFERTRIDDVAREAGVGKGTIYEYFKNKEELMQGAANILMAGVADFEPGPDDTPLNILRATTYHMIKTMEQMGSTYQFFFEYVLHMSRIGDDYGIVGPMLKEFRKGVTAIIEQGIEMGEIRDDIDPYETAAAFLSWFDGAVFHWLVAPDSVSLKAMGDSFLTMIITGIQNTNNTHRGSK